MSNLPNAEEAIFLAALEKGTREEQLAYVEAACAGDSALRKRVLELLASHAESLGPFDAVPPGLKATYVSTDASAADHLGLGLFLVRSHVNAMDGTIRIDSTPGQGTTFVVRLPRAKRILREAGKSGASEAIAGAKRESAATA